MGIQESRFLTGRMSDERFPTDGISEFAKYLMADGIMSTSSLFVSAGNGLSIQITPGEMLVQGYIFRVRDGSISLALAPASSQPRIDRIVARYDHNKGDIYAAILQGVPAASPIAPTLTQNKDIFEVPLARVTVAANASLVSSIVDERPRALAGLGLSYLGENPDWGGDAFNNWPLGIYFTHWNGGKSFTYPWWPGMNYPTVLTIKAGTFGHQLAFGLKGSGAGAPPSIGRRMGINGVWGEWAIIGDNYNNRVLLWTGNWSTGTITVPNSSRFTKFLIGTTSTYTEMVCQKRYNSIRGDAFYVGATGGGHPSMMSASFSGDDWSYIWSGEYSLQTGAYTKRAIEYIYGTI